MTTPLLAACIVVGDDTRDLHDCLASLQTLAPLAAEVCVYSVGAPERVLEFARGTGARVGRGPGADDAADARNRAALMTKLPWVLSLDPSERVAGDVDRLERLLIPHGGMAQPDALSIQVRTVQDGDDRSVVREPRLYRPAVARFTGEYDAALVPVQQSRSLTTLTPGRDVASVWSSLDERDASVERARLERRIARANATLSQLETDGVTGDDLVTALVERARLYRELDEDNAALADLTRARKTRASQAYRWRARQDLAQLLIKHGHFAGATKLIGELEADGSDASYNAWLTAHVSAAQGQAADALRILRELDTVTSADGRDIPEVELLNERMVMAARVGDFDEALECCVALVARHGQARRFGRMLLKLWGGRSPQGLAEVLTQAGGRGRSDVAAALSALAQPGPAVAAILLDPPAVPRPDAVRVM